MHAATLIVLELWFWKIVEIMKMCDLTGYVDFFV